MEEQVKFVQAQVKHFGGVKDVVTIAFRQVGLNLIWGDYASGKTSLLNAFMTALGGKKLSPSDPVHHGEAKAETQIQLSNGWLLTHTISAQTGRTRVVITKPDEPGFQSTQRGMLDEFVSLFALNGSAFKNASPDVRRNLFLQAANVDVSVLDHQYEEAYQERRAINRDVTRLTETLKTLTPPADDLPEEPLQASELIELIQEAEEFNRTLEDSRKKPEMINQRLDQQGARLGETQEKLTIIEQRRAELVQTHEAALTRLKAEEEDAKDLLTRQEAAVDQFRAALAEATQMVRELPEPKDVVTMKAELSTLEARNKAIIQATEHRRLQNELAVAEEKVSELEQAMTKAKEDKQKALDESVVSVPGLSIHPETNDLALNEVPWDSLADTERFLIAVQIVRHENPKCGFVLWDGVESAGEKGRIELTKICEDLGLQLIGTCVGSGDKEACIVMEDGVATVQSSWANSTTE